MNQRRGRPAALGLELLECSHGDDHRYPRVVTWREAEPHLRIQVHDSWGWQNSSDSRCGRLGQGLSSFLTTHQHNIGYVYVLWKLYTMYTNEKGQKQKIKSKTVQLTH